MEMARVPGSFPPRGSPTGQRRVSTFSWGAKHSQIGRPGILPEEGRGHLEIRLMAFCGDHRIGLAGKLGHILIRGKVPELDPFGAKTFSFSSVVVENDFPGCDLAGNSGEENSYMACAENGQSGRGLEDFIKEGGFPAAEHP
jgi:hypothetical protein